jgi:hypothetical protein
MISNIFYLFSMLNQQYDLIIIAVPKLHKTKLALFDLFNLIRIYKPTECVIIERHCAVVYIALDVLSANKYVPHLMHSKSLHIKTMSFYLRR